MGKVLHTVDIDLNKNQLLNAVVQNLTAHPTTPNVGQIYYNTTDTAMYLWNGSVWTDISDVYNHPTYSTLNPTLTGANVLASITVDALGHVDSAATRVLTLSDLGYTGDANANNYIHPTPGVDLGAALAGATVISDVNVNAEGHVVGFATRELTAADVGAAVINDSVTNGVDTWSSTKIQAELDAINSTVAGALVYQGGYDAGTNAPNLDSAPTAGAIDKGFTYTVTVSGTFYGVEVQVGDMLIAEINDPAVEADWTIVNKNIPDIVDATDTVKGIIRLATQAEVDAGALNNVAVTPATLVAFYNAQEGATAHAATIGDTVATSIDIAHTLNTTDVLVEVFDIASGSTVVTEVLRTSSSNVRILTNQPPATNEYRVLIKAI